MNEPAERPIGKLRVPLVVDPRARGPPLPRRAPRPHAGHDPRREPIRLQMGRTASGERHAGGARRTQPPERERRDAGRFPLVSISGRRQWRQRHRIGTMAIEEHGDADLPRPHERGEPGENRREHARARTGTTCQRLLSRSHAHRMGSESDGLHRAPRRPGLERDSEERHDGRGLVHGDGRRKASLVHGTVGQTADPVEPIG